MANLGLLIMAVAYDAAYREKHPQQYGLDEWREEWWYGRLHALAGEYALMANLGLV